MSVKNEVYNIQNQKLKVNKNLVEKLGVDSTAKCNVLVKVAQVTSQKRIIA